MKKKLSFAILTIIAIFITYKYLGIFLSNQWLLLTGRGYSIPSESTVFSFNPRIMNKGSGEWWIYGEDDSKYYYAGDGIIPSPYVMIEKSDAAKCSGFDPINFKTWCKHERPKTDI